jgi:hypothetical protein
VLSEKLSKLEIKNLGLLTMPNIIRDSGTYKRPTHGNHYGRRKRDEVARVYAKVKTICETAKITNVDPETISRWKKQESFMERLELFEREVDEENDALVCADRPNNIHKAIEMRDNPHTAENVQLGCIRTLDEMYDKVVEKRIGNKRMTRIESQIATTVTTSINVSNDSEEWIRNTADWTDESQEYEQ